MTMTLTPPKSGICEVLKELIVKPSVKETDMHPFNGFRDAISELKNRYRLPLRHVDIKGKSKHGKKRKYRKHFLLTISRPRAIRLYQKLNQA